MTFSNIGWWEVFFGGVSTLAIYSFLYRENPFYRFFEHLYIGIATGITVMLSFKGLFWPVVVKPMLGLDIVVFPDGTTSQSYNPQLLLYFIPIVFGGFYYFIFSKRLNWLSQLAIGFSLGVGAGFAIRGVFVEMMPQIYDSFRPLYVPDAKLETFSNIIFVFTLFTTLSYFFFTFRRSQGGMVERASVAGRWMMMICFGAFFGTTIMARMALLVERLEFLIDDWIPNISLIFS